MVAFRDMDEFRDIIDQIRSSNSVKKVEFAITDDLQITFKDEYNDIEIF